MNRNNFSRRHFLKAATLTICGTILAGCEEISRINFLPPPEKVHLKVMVPDDILSDQEMALFQESFERWELARFNTDESLMNKMVANGEELDIFSIQAHKFPYLARKGYLQDITESVLKSSNIQPNSLFPVNAQCTWKDRRYGLVTHWSPDFFVWINKHLWARTGIPFLWETRPEIHLSEWRSLSSRLSKINNLGEIIGTDFEIDLLGLLWLATTFEPAIEVYNLEGSRMILSSQPAFIELVQWIMEWKREGGIPVKLISSAIENFTNCDCVSKTTQDLPNTIMTFISGSSSAQDWLQAQAVATLQGIDYGKKIINSQVDENDIMTLPAPRYGSKKSNPSIRANAMGISVNCRQPESAWQFLEWYINGAPAVERTRLGVGLPANMNYLHLLPQKSTWQKQLFETCVNELAETDQSGISLSAYFDLELLNHLWNQQEEMMLRNQKKLEVALADFEEQANQFIGSS